MQFSPDVLYSLLGASGSINQMPGGNAFWSQPEATLNEIGMDWLVSEFACEMDWPSWEMHPNGDEFVYLLEGDIQFILHLPQGVQAHRITNRGAVVVPKGIWHTAKVFRSSRMLFITLGAETQHKPIEPRSAV